MEKQIKSRNMIYSLIIAVLLTVLVAGYELMVSACNYKSGMNFLDFASYANSNLNIYCIVLIIANLIIFPFSLKLYKANNINLKDEIYDKSTLKKDVFLGVVLAVISSLLCLFSILIGKGRTNLSFAGWGKLSFGQIILMIISLVFVSGIFKEIVYRGLPKSFGGTVLGQNISFLIFNILFGLLDWFNIGHSFVVGLIWIFGYKKSKHLIVPMIAHGGMNLISIFFYIFTF